MRINKVVRKTVVRGAEGDRGTNLAADVSAVVSANVGDDGRTGSNRVSLLARTYGSFNAVEARPHLGEGSETDEA